MKIKEFYNKHRKVIYWLIFIIYGLINLVLTLLHEPWRDEIHTWLLSKELTIPEIFVESRFDGHPILWHLLLMPFAKNGFPILTLNIVSYVIMLVATWIFLFKSKIPDVIKIFSVFTIPFTYVFSAISRNYSLFILFLVIIGVLYKDRYKYPLIYSVLICFLIHTHALAWGIVAGLTITFHIYEILLSLRKKNNLELKKAIIGLVLIAVNTIIVVLQLYGTSNMNYSTEMLKKVIKPSITAMIFLFLFIAYTVFVLKKNYKECIIITLRNWISTIYLCICIFSNNVPKVHVVLYFDAILSNFITG